MGGGGLDQKKWLWSSWSIEIPGPRPSLSLPVPAQTLEGLGRQHRSKPHLSLLVWFKSLNFKSAKPLLTK